MINTKASIIIPVYNSEKTVKRAIDSAIAQSFENKEIIVVDDGSFDQSQTIIEKYNDSVKVIRTEHLGVSNARNVGIENSCGDYILFLDSDDYLLPNCLNTMMNNINDSEILCCSFVIKNRKRTSTYYLDNKELNQEQFIRRLCKIDSNFDYMYAWGKLFKRSVMTEDIFPVGVKIGEDVVALIRATLKAARIKIIDEPVYVYDRGESVVTKKFFEADYLDLYTAWELIKKEFEKTSPVYIDYADINIWRQDYTILTRLLLSEEITRKENISLIKEANKRLKQNCKKLLSSGIVLSRKIMMLTVLFASEMYLKTQKP